MRQPPKLADHARQLRHDDTLAEKHAWVLLRDRRSFGLKFRRQVPIEGYIVDFYCPELCLVIELDGGSHNDPRQFQKDMIRDARLEKAGFKVLRVPNETILRDEESFIEQIRFFAEELPSPGASRRPLPLRGRGQA